VPQEGLTIKQYAAQAREWHPDDSYLTDREITKRYLRIYPEHKSGMDTNELRDLYSIQPDQRGSDVGFSFFQAKEMLANIPSAAVGGLAALTGSEDLLQYSEELRMKALEDTRERMADPEIQGYLNWMETEPISLQNFLQPQMFQRGLAQAAPSIAAMLAVDIGLNLVTYGIGGTALRTGRLATGGFKMLSAAKKGEKATEGAVKFVKASEKIRTAGTMATMGGLEGSEQYNSTIQYLLEKGVDLKQANKVAGISGAAYAVASSILEYIPYGAFKKRLGIGSIKNRKMFEERMINALQRQGALQTGRTITKPMIQQAILESGTEWSQYLTSELINYYNKRGYEEVPESALKYLHKQMFTPEAVESAYSGAAMGITMGLLPGAKTALSGKTRIEQVLSETPEDVRKEISDETKAQEEMEAEPVSQSGARVKLGAFIGSYDNLSEEEQEIARELQSNYVDDEKKSFDEVHDVIKNNPESLNDLSDEERFDVFAGLSDLAPEKGIDDFQKEWEDSLEPKEEVVDEPVVEDIKDETVEEVIDEPIDEPIEEEAEALDITPKKKEEPKKKAAPKKKAPKQSLDRVSITFDDSGDLSVQVDDKNVELLDKEIDALQSGIAFDKENDDESKIKKASLDILKRVDAPAKDEPQIDEPTEEGALDITPKETLPKLRKRAQGLGIENVKKKNTKTLLSEIAALEESKKVEERVEAHDRAAHPELFEDEKEEVHQKLPKKKTYEVTTRGDARFSAFNAKLSDGKSIEEHYQVGVKGYSSIKEGKGKPPKDKNKDLDAEYQALWDRWADENPDLIEDLREKSKGKKLTDMFSKEGGVNQATALTRILERTSPKKANVVKGKKLTLYRGVPKDKEAISPVDKDTGTFAFESEETAPYWGEDVYKVEYTPKNMIEATDVSDAQDKLIDMGANVDKVNNQLTEVEDNLLRGIGMGAIQLGERVEADQAMDKYVRLLADQVGVDAIKYTAYSVGTGQMQAEEGVQYAIYGKPSISPVAKKPAETSKGKPILRSGGAKGADTVFEDAAMEAGHEVEAMSFKGHDTKSKNRKKILPSLLKKADKFLKRANKTLKRVLPNEETKKGRYVRNLLRRNYFQVKDSDQIIAVAPLKYGSLTEVDGGTMWAIQMAIDLGKKDIHLFDLSKGEWLKWVETPNGARFLPAPAPVLGNNYTGIGSRIISTYPKGVAAIKALYEKPRKLTNQEKAMGFEEGDIEASIKATEEMMEKEKRSDEIDNEIAMENEQVDKSTPKEEVDQSRKKSKLKENEVQEDEVNEKIDVERFLIFQERQDSQDFHYTEGQKNVLSKVVDYLSSKIENIKEDYFVFAGYAGTGKTTIVENIANYAKKQGMSVYVAAPTNKAVLRLDEKRQEELEDPSKPRYDAALSTLHSILYGSPDEDGIWVPKTADMDESTLVIIDEASMISTEVWNDIQKYISPTGAKIILIGDGFQLPPVGGEVQDPHLMDRFISKGYQLVNVVRQAAESGIIKWATALRVNKSILYPNESTNDVVILEEKELLEKYYNDIINNEDSIVIVSTNKDRTRINGLARQRKFGENASINLVNDGEHLIVVNNSKFKRKNGETFIYEGDDIVPSKAIEVEYVEKMEWNKETKQRDIPVYKKTKIYAFKDKDGNPILVAPDLESASLHGGSITLADKLKDKNDMGKLGKAFPDHVIFNPKSGKYQFSDTTNVVTYGYAITAHKSQGSEWKNVYVAKDFGWAKFMDEEGKARWLYTAITRASENLFLNKDLITNGASWGEIQFVMNRAGAIENDNTNEKLQRISKGQKIDSNKELAVKIAARLKKQFPFIDANAVERVYDRFGREVSGRAIDTMVEWSLTKGTLDTIPHEYAHIYIDLLRKSPIVQNGIEKFRQEGDTLEQAEERLVQYIGEYYANRIQVDSIAKRVGIWLKQFWLNIRKAFGNIKKEQIGDYLAEKFYQDSIAKQTAVITGKERLQVIESGTDPWIQTIKTFDNGYKRYIRHIRKNSGWWRKSKPRKEDKDALITQYLNILEANNIGVEDELFGEPLKAWLDEKGYTEGSEYKIDFDMDDSQAFFENLWENLNRNLSSISVKDKDMTSINKANYYFMKDLGIVSQNALKRLYRTARRIELHGDNGFLNLISITIKKSLDTLTNKEINAAVQFYNSARSSVKTNRDNPLENERTHYELFLVERELTKGTNLPPGAVIGEDRKGTPVYRFFSLKRKKAENREGKSNPKNERKTLVEHHVNIQDIAWISSGDIIHYVNEEEKSLYNPLSSGQISQLSTSLRKKDVKGINSLTGTKDWYMVGFNRGENEKYGLVLVTQEHRDKAKQGEAYWKEQGLTQKQIDNFMLKRFENDERFSKDIIEMVRAEEIARYEALNRIFPDFMNHPASKVFKRLKLPLTEAVVSKDMPSQIGRIFDKDNATFVVKDKNGKDKAVDTIVDVEGTLKYRLDGSSLTSTKLFKDFIKYFGMKINVAKAKTVIHALGEGSKLYVKHQHFKPLKPVSIYENYGKENEVLVAKIDENGYITDSEGNDIHVLFTDEEAKIFDGDFVIGQNFTIPGNAFGLLNMPNKKHSDTKSTMQLYNYIHDKNILNLWKTHMFPKFQKRLKAAFHMGMIHKAKSPQLQIKQFFDILSNGDTGLPDSAFELFKLGLGLHSFGASLLDKIVQTQVVTEATTMAKMPGLSGDTIADYTDELGYTEISVPMADATVIIQDYIKAADEHGDRRTFDEIKSDGMEQVNKWLETANYQMLISRSPVPHIGGAKMVTVKSLHGNDGQIHLNWMLLFKDLEGDGDGDKVQIEKLPKELEEEFVKLYKDLEVKAIDLNKLGKPREYDLSLREDLNELISAITYGSKAIAEVSNAQMSFGILQETFNYIEMSGIDNPYKLKVRSANDIIKEKNMGHSDTIDNILRIYLQAAADNVEFLLLKEWDYTQEGLWENLFYRDDGKALNNDDKRIIQLLMRTTKKPSAIRYGRTFKKAFSFTDTINESSSFNKFANNKENYIENIIEKWETEGVLTSVRFKLDSNGDFMLHPHEMIASEIDKMYREQGFEKPWHEGSPFVLNQDLYYQAHLHTINQMMSDESIREEMEGAEALKGVKYARQMAMELDDMYVKIKAMGKDIGIQGWDTNELMIAFADKYRRDFNALTPIERKAATYQYLQGTKRRVGREFKSIAERRIMLPSSKDPNKLSLLDADTLSAFFDIYNAKIISELATSQDFKLNPLQAESIARLNLLQMTREEKDVVKNCGKR